MDSPNRDSHTSCFISHATWGNQKSWIHFRFMWLYVIRKNETINDATDQQTWSDKQTRERLSGRCMSSNVKTLAKTSVSQAAVDQTFFFSFLFFIIFSGIPPLLYAVPLSPTPALASCLTTQRPCPEKSRHYQPRKTLPVRGMLQRRYPSEQCLSDVPPDECYTT